MHVKKFSSVTYMLFNKLYSYINIIKGLKEINRMYVNTIDNIMYIGMIDDLFHQFHSDTL